MGRAPSRPIVYDFARPAMLDIGFQEILVMGVIALLVFGPDKLPDLGKRLGRAMREFRRASDDFRQHHRDKHFPRSTTIRFSRRLRR